MDNQFFITDNAALKISDLLADESTSESEMYLRISITGGGCSGFEYVFSFDDERNEDEDFVFEKNGAKVLIDYLSFQYLANAEVDFVQTPMKTAFSISNPNATTTCGCGSSFG